MRIPFAARSVGVFVGLVILSLKFTSLPVCAADDNAELSSENAPLLVNSPNFQNGDAQESYDGIDYERTQFSNPYLRDYGYGNMISGDARIWRYPTEKSSEFGLRVLYGNHDFWRDCMHGVLATNAWDALIDLERLLAAWPDGHWISPPNLSQSMRLWDGEDDFESQLSLVSRLSDVVKKAPDDEFRIESEN